MNKKEYEELKKINHSGVREKLTEAYLKQSYYSEEELFTKTVSTAYILMKLQENNISIKDKNLDIKGLIEILDVHTEVKTILNNYTDEETLWITKFFLGTFEIEELLAFIIFTTEDIRYLIYPRASISNILPKLALQILEIKDNDTVLDAYSGLGEFEIESYLDNPNHTVKILGNEINKILLDVATLKLSLVYDTYLEKIFENKDISEKEIDYKVNKIFVNTPFPNNQKEGSLELKISKLLFNNLTENGKMVTVFGKVSLSSMRSIDKNIREEFIKNGLVNAVIKLPSRVFESIGMLTELVVFSKNNKGVRFIDASNIINTKEFSDENIMEVLDLINKDNNISIFKSNESILEKNCNLDVDENLKTLYEVEGGVKFETVIKKIVRGTQTRISNLEELKTNDKTDYIFLTLTNINDGVIDYETKIQYLTDIPKDFEKYCVENNSVLISKIGSPQFAVAKIETGKKILANANILSVEIDENKLNPWYLVSFLNSDKGKEYMRYVYRGGTILSLSINDLNEMIIPLPSLEEQNKIAKQYIEIIEEMKNMKEKLEEKRNELKKMF